jgi:hypothetical protein
VIKTPQKRGKKGVWGIMKAEVGMRNAECGKKDEEHRRWGD